MFAALSAIGFGLGVPGDAHASWRPAQVTDGGAILHNCYVPFKEPSRACTKVTTLPKGTRLFVACQQQGDMASGMGGRSDRWDFVYATTGRAPRPSGYVADVDISWSGHPIDECH